jgi:hypothetical protein
VSKYNEGQKGSLGRGEALGEEMVDDKKEEELEWEWLIFCDNQQGHMYSEFERI